MTTWEELRDALVGLRDSQALLGSPYLLADDVPPPYRISLPAWATREAEDLHLRFDSDVQLVVGVMTFPDRKLRHSARPRTTVELTEGLLKTWIAGPNDVPSGHHIISKLGVRSLSEEDLVIVTNGAVTAVAVDPLNQEPAGTCEVPQTLPGVRFRLSAKGTVEMPLIIGTASLVPDLGYSVPPGKWAITVDLTLEDRRRVRTPPLPISVTAT